MLKLDFTTAMKYIIMFQQ